MDLQTLAQRLREMAQKSNTITLDQNVLPPDETPKIARAFLLKEQEYLTIHGVSSADVPDPLDNVLTIKAGAARALNVDAVAMKLTFALNNDRVCLVITGVMPAGWSLQNSFPNLNLFSFNQFTLVDPCFIYASQNQDSYTPWATKPQEAMPLQAGLNFAAWLKLDKFSSILALLAIGGDSLYKFYGPLTSLPECPYPVATLSAALSAKDFSIGYAPLTLTLSNPAITAQISEPKKRIQEINLFLTADSSLGLNFGMGLSDTGGTLVFMATPKPGQPFADDKIKRLPGGADFQSFIPGELGPIFDVVVLQYFTMVMLTETRSLGYLEFAISADKPWEILKDVIQLDSLVLQLSLLNPAGGGAIAAVSVAAKARLLPSIFAGDFAFAIGIRKTPDTGWQVATIQGEFLGSVKLGDLVKGILGSAEMVPQELYDIAFSNFGINIDRINNSYTCYGNCEICFPLLGTEFIASLAIKVYYAQQTYEVKLSGALNIGGEDFAVALDFSKLQKDKGNIYFTASWTATDNNYLQFEDIIGAFGFTPPAIPQKLDLSLKNIFFTYDYGAEVLALEAESVNYGKTVLVCLKDKQDQWLFFFGMAVDTRINLSNLPLIDKVLTPEQTLAIQNIRFVVSSIDQTLVSTVNGHIKDGYPKAPLTTSNGFVISADFNFGGSVFPVNIGTGGSTQTANTSTAASANAEVVPLPGELKGGNIATASQPTDGTIWLNVQKAFGPVMFKRVGVRYQQNVLSFPLDAALLTKSLTISLDGLAVGMNIQDLTLKFHLDGLGINYTNPPVAIGGSFLAKTLKSPDDKGFDYAGTAIIKTDAFALSAIGSYAKSQNEPSMFVFVEIDEDFGGPPYLYITGLMTGFGYNRKLRIPGQNEVFDFPLLSNLGAGKSGTEILDALEDHWLTVCAEEDWLAVGVHFLSYELVDSRALLVAEFGREFQLLVLGLSTLKLPKEGNSFVYVEMALEAVVKPAEGFFGITAVLSNNSFVLDPGCRLTGGFAFYTWYSGDKEGNFVVTAGGYHPAFPVPSYYPKVPRLAFNWPVSNYVTIKGEAYFALTPSCAMGGGKLEILFHDGNLQAWFIAQADLLIQWKPFHYKAFIGVDVGVSYRLHLLFTSVTLRVELGASLELWGPPTGGKVHIDWYIISFTIGFGPSENPVVTLTWDQFKTTMLPDTVCIIKVTDGLLQDTGNCWLVRPDDFAFNIQSAMPADTIINCISPTGDNLQETTITLAAGDQVSIRPMRLTSKINSTLEVTLEKIDEKKYLDLSSTGNIWNTQIPPRRVPQSLWGLDDVSPLDPDMLLTSLSEINCAIKDSVLGPAPGAIDMLKILAYETLMDEKGVEVKGVLPFTKADASNAVKLLAGQSLRQADDEPAPVILAPGWMQMYDSYIPNLGEGDYLISVTQNVTGNGVADTFSQTQKFTVTGPRFTLDAAEIHSCFPPANSTGQYADCLPHIVLNKRVLPWERKLIGLDKKVPWMVLLLFDEAQLSDTIAGQDVNKASPTKTYTGTVAELLNPESGVRKPNINLDPSASERQTSCRSIQIPKDAFCEIMPQLGEIPYLAHCRQVNTGNSELAGINDQGWYSVIVGNRFPGSGTGNPPPGAKNIAHLVSLDGFEDVLQNPALLQDFQAVRMVSLAGWQFSCQPDGAENLVDLLKGIVANAKGLGDPKQQFLELPASDISGSPAEQAKYRNGYVKLNYRDSAGNDSFAWYRGPLAPCNAPKISKTGPYFTAHEAVIPDPDTGFADLSYAVAWQIGRALALADKSFAIHLLNFRRQGHRLIDLLLMRLNSDHLDTPEDLKELISDNLIREKFITILDTEFAGKVAACLSARASNLTQDNGASKLSTGKNQSGASPIDELKDFMQRDDVQELMGQVLESELRPVAEWLAQLILLVNIPFNHLAPDARMLPVESVRFFYLDTNWLDALVDGALSAGAHSSRDTFYYQMMEESIRDAVKIASLKIRDQLTGKETPADIEKLAMDEPVTGILIRSGAIAGWPGLGIVPSQNNQPLKILRMERLSPNVLFGLFLGAPDRLEINQPHGTLHFGVDQKGDIELRQLGDPVGKSIKFMNIKANTDFFTSETRILKIVNLQAALKGQPGVASPDYPWGSAGFAVQLINEPVQLIFDDKVV